MCDTYLLESNSSEIVQVEGSLVNLQSNGKAQAVVTNTTGYTQTLKAGIPIGTMSQCDEVKLSEVRLLTNSTKAWVNKIISQDGIGEAQSIS